VARFCVLGHWRPAHCAASMRIVYNARQNAPWCAHVCNTRQTMCITKFICGEKTLDPLPQRLCGAENRAGTLQKFVSEGCE